MNERLANDLIRYAELVEDGALISPEEMNCAAVMRLAAEALVKQEPRHCTACNGRGKVETGIGMMVCDNCHGKGEL